MANIKGISFSASAGPHLSSPLDFKPQFFLSCTQTLCSLFEADSTDGEGHKSRR